MLVVQSCKVKHSNIFFEYERYNQKIHDTKPCFENRESSSGTDYNKKSNQEASDCYIKGLILVPMVIMKTIYENLALIFC
jgi:hypothetical protein